MVTAYSSAPSDVNAGPTSIDINRGAIFERYFISKIFLDSILSGRKKRGNRFHYENGHRCHSKFRRTFALIVAIYVTAVSNTFYS